MKVVWRKKKAYTRQTKSGKQRVKAHKQRYTIYDKSDKNITDSEIRDRLFTTQFANQLSQQTLKNGKNKRKRKKKK